MGRSGILTLKRITYFLNTGRSKNCSLWCFTARKQNLGQGNVFTPDCQSFCSQRVLYTLLPGQIPPQADTPTPHLGRHPPWADASTRQTPPQGRQPPRQTPLGRHPPGRHPHRQTPHGQAPLDVNWSGRYVSYWNAFLCFCVNALIRSHAINFLFQSGHLKKILTGHNNLVQSLAFSHKYSLLVRFFANQIDNHSELIWFLILSYF